jgi:hypothetical protein
MLASRMPRPKSTPGPKRSAKGPLPRLLLAAVLLASGTSLCGRLPQATQSSLGQFPATPAADLVAKCIQHELDHAGDPTQYMFLMRRKTAHVLETKLMVQTNEAIAGRVLSYNDRPMTDEGRKNEDARVDRFVKNPDELRKKQREEHDNRERLNRVLRAMPEALLYEYVGFEPAAVGLGHKGEDLLRVQFRPNPDYDPPTRVEQLLTGMAGTILLDPQRQRLARIDGTLQKDVAFGWGILGHLDKGGRILLEQGELADGNWVLTHFMMRFTGKVLFFKGLDVNTTETSWDFHRVPDDLSFAQGLALLKKQEAEIAKSGVALNHGLE